MESPLPIRLGTVVLDCPNPRALADFYLKLLGWQQTMEDEDWIDIAPPGGGVKLGFQREPDYQPPAWPSYPPGQQQMLHLDFEVESPQAMARAVRHAEACGARRAEVQYDDRWTVMLDPAGHPFCFVIWP